MKAKAPILNPPLVAFEHKRDAYGFPVRPQHVQRYREYATIYKEEEEERSDRWKDFLERQSECAQLPVNGSSAEKDRAASLSVASGKEANDGSDKSPQGADLSDEKTAHDDLNVPEAQEDEFSQMTESKTHRAQIWTRIRPSLRAIEDMMNDRVKKKISLTRTEEDNGAENLGSLEDAKPTKAGAEEDSEDVFYDLERSESEPTPEVPSSDGVSAPTPGATSNAVPQESSIPWKEELEFLVQGGVPMALRGELWQAFVGVKARHIKNYYQNLLLSDSKNDNSVEHQISEVDEASKLLKTDSIDVPEKWKGQIEKDLPRTFPGHPALDEGGRNALRRLLTAYARHNPCVGYCQAMNFFAGLLLLLMPEENAFWALMGILDDYFEGYYSEEMIESQVDQLVFEELVRERFPKLVNHLDYLGVQIAWVSGPWFLSIFMNMLPWESVLRVWDVLLFQGNRVMLFRTALSLMELYGPALVTTKDAGDAVTLLQSLAGSTFDSSQLVLTACMGYQNVNEERLRELRNKHRPAVQAALEERSKGLNMWRDSQGLVSKLYGLKENKTGQTGDKMTNGALSRNNSESSNADESYMGVSGDVEINSVPDLQEQVAWLKNELCKILEEKRSAILRAEELETALMEMVKQDNRRELSAKVEQLERDIADLQQALADKQEQENAMLQVLMRVEQEQKVTEDARRYAEQDAAAQRYATAVLQEKYEAATASLAEMEKRVVMAESMLEATLQYQSGQNKAQPSPRSANQDSSAIRTSQELSQEIPARKISLLSRPFGLGWRDKNKAKPAEEQVDVKTSGDEQNPKAVKLAEEQADEQNSKGVQENIIDGHEMEQVSLADEDGK
ncbi:ecotropic viral integration site 5 protein homolog [Cynara cardunculus var. scolymus]|uniref:ecotropic viral integration site 5 protein homolog n=1 Tax=Cynara cardunculus var. scolymus TaxID=59895 RepID=UPI000D62AB89|nr:ecotropic viral integration site 5 protein homolog [Cynara cardunculus var. scolymus]XP_024960583.1 ecotropic viral integration site 5 protein homolog [Cynara cardunculus var. scolymus]